MRATRGFTLIEMLVSTAIFTVVMVIALGALLTMSESDRQAQVLKSVIDNLNFSLDSMSRAIRTGTGYGCTAVGGNCPPTGSPGTYFSFVDAGGRKVAYCLDGSTIKREVTGGALDTSCSAAGFAAVTAPEVVITSLGFYLVGSAPGPDSEQPILTILMSGYVQVTGTRQTAFNLQTSIAQRLYDQ